MRDTTISLICPSRNRPHLFRNMWYSAMNNAVGNVQIILGLDKDEPRRDEYDKISTDPYIIKYVFDETPESMAGINNELAMQATGAYIMLVNDDCVFKTPGWDAMIKSAFPEDKLALVYPNDGNCPGKCVFPCVHQYWIDVIGYLCNDELYHWYIDDWMYDTALKADRAIYLDAVEVEHQHALFGKGVYDDTFTRRFKKDRIEADKAHYKKMVGDRKQDAAFLKQAIERS